MKNYNPNEPISEENLPDYVWFSKVGRCAMRKQASSFVPKEIVPNIEYYRDAGMWSVYVKIVEGKLLSVWQDMQGNNHDLIPCTKEEWEKDNEGYV